MLHHLQMASIAGQPQWRVSLLVLHVHCRLPRQQKLHKAVVSLLAGDGEGGVSRQRHRRCVDVSTLVEQHPTHLQVAPRGSLHQRSESRLGSMLYVGLPVHQHTHHLMPALEAGQSKRCVAVRLNLRVDVTAKVKQQVHCVHIATHGCQHERRYAQLAASSRVDLSSVLHQQVDDLVVSCRCSKAEWRVVGDISMFDVCTVNHQLICHIKLAI